jgi:aromatic-L-amino-acid decarboxylase
MDIPLLERAITEDRGNNLLPVLVIGTAGDVSTGAVDDLKSIAEICKKKDCWFHVDGAYGVPAAVVPEQHALFEGMADADSIALDPHKWLYAPLEAGCTLVKDPKHLIQTYSSHPGYFNFDNDGAPEARNFYEYGFQNSRGFRALKVWMLQAVSHNLSITTLRYCPSGYSEADLNRLNELLLNDLQRNGEVFLSNAIVGDKYCLRACIVNFRTTEKDIQEIIEIIVRTGRRLSDKKQVDRTSQLI